MPRCCGSTARRRVPIAGFLRYVNDSPVAARIGKITSDAEAVGGGRLALKIGLPLGRPEDTKVIGEFAFADAQLRIPGAPLPVEARRQAVVHGARRQRA